MNVGTRRLDRTKQDRPVGAGWATSLLLAALLPALCGLTARGDWDVGDPFKMHYPQLPDPNGWDIFFLGESFEVADDWLCTATGPVEDLHFWYSARGDNYLGITSVTASIYSNNPQGPGGFSIPAELLWSRTFLQGQFVERLVGTGTQGFAEPVNGPGGWVLNDHNNYYQLNITEIDQPFVQEQGTIYWLGLWVTAPQSTELGWKTSLDKFEDDAVFRDPTGAWIELVDPVTLQSLDMAFVITPEPTGLASMVVAAASGGFLYRRRRRASRLPSGRRSASQPEALRRVRARTREEVVSPIAERLDRPEGGHRLR
jgi:hypothetical protein